MNLKKYLFLFSLFLMTFLVARKHMVFSGEFTSTSATLNNARLSFLSALEGAQTIGSSLVTIDTANFPSESVLQLQNRDTVLINNSLYTVATTIDDASDNTFNLTSGLDSGDVTNDMTVYSSASATLTVRLTTISAINDGSFRILVPAAADDGTDHDNIPDSGGFEFGVYPTATITCPITGSYGTFTASETPADTSTIFIGGIYYHSFVCDYDGLGAVGTPFDGTTEEAFVISDLINPAPKSAVDNHTLGQADTYAVIIQHLDSAGGVVDQTLTKIGVIDAVKVSASIAPQITFTIAGTASGQSRCGVSTDVTTTALTVPFGALTVGSFVDASQRLTVTTNALNGYAVTAAEDDQVGRGANICVGDSGASVTCITDTNVTGATHTVTSSIDWTNASTYPGFGYSLASAVGSPTMEFEWDDITATTGFAARQFADLEKPEAVQTIFSKNTVTASDAVDVCYRISPAATNAAGDYENYLVYTASATF